MISVLLIVLQCLVQYKKIALVSQKNQKIIKKQQRLVDTRKSGYAVVFPLFQGKNSYRKEVPSNENTFRVVYLVVRNVDGLLKRRSCVTSSNENRILLNARDCENNPSLTLAQKKFHRKCPCIVRNVIEEIMYS